MDFILMKLFRGAILEWGLHDYPRFINRALLFQTCHITQLLWAYGRMIILLVFFIEIRVFKFLFGLCLSLVFVSGTSIAKCRERKFSVVSNLLTAITSLITHWPIVSYSPLIFDEGIMRASSTTTVHGQVLIVQFYQVWYCLNCSGFHTCSSNERMDIFTRYLLVIKLALLSLGRNPISTNRRITWYNLTSLQYSRLAVPLAILGIILLPFTLIGHIWSNRHTIYYDTVVTFSGWVLNLK